MSLGGVSGTVDNEATGDLLLADPGCSNDVFSYMYILLNIIAYAYELVYLSWLES